MHIKINDSGILIFFMVLNFMVKDALNRIIIFHACQPTGRRETFLWIHFIPAYTI